MEKNKTVKWFVLALDDNSYKFINSIPAGHGWFQINQKDIDKNNLNVSVFECDYEFLCTVHRNKSNSTLKFIAYKQVGYGPMRKHNLQFSNIKKRRLIEEVNRIKARVKK